MLVTTNSPLGLGNRRKGPRVHAETNWHRMYGGLVGHGSGLHTQQNDPTLTLRELTGMSRTAWFSAFGLPFFFPSVLSLAEFPGSKQSGAWLGTVCPLWTTGIPIVQETARLSGCTISPTPKGQEAQTESWLTHIKAQGLELTQVKSLATTG